MVGRPTEFKPEYCDQLIDHMSTGMSYESFAAEIRVGRSTIYDWENSHPMWKEAKEIGLQCAHSFFEKRLIAKTAGQAIQGVDPKLVDTACLIFALKTRFHKTYSEKSDDKNGGGNTFKFNIVKYEKPKEKDDNPT